MSYLPSYQSAVQKLAVLAFVALALTACTFIVPPPALPAGANAISQPAADEYDLGDAFIVQEQFPEDSDFRNMPVRLNGVIAVPDSVGPHPVVLILHGTHPGCPETEHGLDRWPCDPAVEQPNYRGFAYLVSDLAAQGYVALAPNINAENTFGFGEGVPGKRLEQIVDLHLRALAAAASGQDQRFGVELTGRADVSKLAVFGHSRGGEAAIILARDLAAQSEQADLVYGPVDGLLLIAGSPGFADPAEGAPSPLAVLLPACDADVINQDGQVFYEALRLRDTHDWATSVWLERANHNQFNTILPADPFGLIGRLDCDPLLDGESQRDFLTAYSVDFLTTLFSPDPAQVRAAMQRMGVTVDALAVDSLYGLTAQAAYLPAPMHRLPLLTPDSDDSFSSSPIGGDVSSEGLETIFCPTGYYTPYTNPELAPCRRAHVVVPGQPAHAVVSWQEPGASMRFDLPPGLGNLLLFDALSVRAAVDPLSPLNSAGLPQAFSVEVIDGEGRRAIVPVRDDEPALQFPQGELGDDFLGTPLFSGRAPLMPVRVPIDRFREVNLADVSQIAIVFDQTDSGTLFVADVELVRSPISSQETLGGPPSAEMIASAHAGDVEAQRQLANLYRPTEALGVQYGNLEQAVFWYRKACAAGYANAQVDFFLFARDHAALHDDTFLDEALTCQDDAVSQGHREAIVQRAFHAAYVEQDLATAFYLHALLEEVDPVWAAQRFAFSQELTQAEMDAAEEAAAAWRASNAVKDYEDFFKEIGSPFRQVTSQPYVLTPASAGHCRLSRMDATEA